MATPISPAHLRITSDYDMCHGQPVVRGLRYPVWSVLEYLTSGMTEAEILADFADLEAENLRACQAYAAFIVKKVSHAMSGDGTRRPVTKQQMLAHLLETGQLPLGTILNERGQIQKLQQTRPARTLAPMPVPTPSRQQPPAAVVALANAVPNVLWSGLAWGPVAVFGYRYVERGWLWGLVGVSLLAYAWPVAWLWRLQLSDGLGAYEQLGVPQVGYLTQGGGLVLGWLRRRYPSYRVLVGRAGMERLRRTTYQQERFHWAALGLFLELSGYAAATGRWKWALGLTLLNVGYNLYPIWLQQYLRLRLGRLGPR